MEGFTICDSAVNQLRADSVSEEKRGKCISVKDMYGLKTYKSMVTDARVHDDNFAFLTSNLAKLHTDLVQPLVHTTWAKDIPAETGGGFVDFVEWHSVDWAGIMNANRNIVGNGVNYIPRVNASMNQHLARVYTFEVAYDLRFIELEKLNKLRLQKSIQEIYKTSILAGWDYFVQSVAYLGVNGSTGFFNSTTVSTTSVTNTGTTGKGFAGLSDGAVVAFFNGIYERYLSESNMNIAVLPDTILVPTYVYSDLVSRFSPLYTSNLLEFIVTHNMGNGQDSTFKLSIQPRPALNDLNGGKGRVVAYRKAKEFVRIDIPYPMQHYVTLPNIERSAYTSMFVGQVSDVQLPYNASDADFGPVTYWDFSNKA